MLCDYRFVEERKFPVRIDGEFRSQILVELVQEKSSHRKLPIPHQADCKSVSARVKKKETVFSVVLTVTFSIFDTYAVTLYLRIERRS